MQNQQMQQKQQELEQQQQQAQAAIASAQQAKAEQMAHEDYQNELDRINKIQIAMIAAESKAGPLSDLDKSGTADVLEMNKLSAETSKAAKDYELKVAEIQNDNKKDNNKMTIEREKLKVERENQANDVEVAKINARNRASKSK
jgi:type II secretory pathway pseudopilin PulG